MSEKTMAVNESLEAVNPENTAIPAGNQLPFLSQVDTVLLVNKFNQAVKILV